MVKFYINEDIDYARYLCIQKLNAKYQIINFDDFESLKQEVNQINFFETIRNYVVLNFTFDTKKNKNFYALNELDQDKNIFFIIDQKTFKDIKSYIETFETINIPTFNILAKKKIIQDFLNQNQLSDLVDQDTFNTLVNTLPNEFDFFINELKKIALINHDCFQKNLKQALQNYDEVNIFYLIDSIFYKEKAKALSIIDQNNNQDFLNKLFILLGTQIYKLIIFDQAVRQKLPLNNVFKSNYEISKLRTLNSMYSISDLNEINEKLTKIDYLIKNKASASLYNELKLLILNWI